MKWVNLKSGSVKDSVKRPDKDSLIVVEVAHNGRIYPSTLEGIVNLCYNEGYDDIEKQDAIIEILQMILLLLKP